MNEKIDAPPMSISDIQNALKDRRLYVIAEETGLSYPTLKKLADGEKGNYTLSTLSLISSYLRNRR